ncbi:hypothetical protein ACWEP4_45320, partial [Streptomyces sp. NPDC004227]
LDGIDLDDLTAVREIAQAYRHRVLMRYNPQATRDHSDGERDARLRYQASGKYVPSAAQRRDVRAPAAGSR